MLFNSIEYLIFLPVVFILYWFVFNRSLRLQNILILTSSYIFYGWWSWKFLLLLLISTVLDYGYGFGVANPKRKVSRFFLWLSIINNLGILFFFKYYNFFISDFVTCLSMLVISFDLFLINIILPVGISFYTFHGLSYVFDIYRGKQQPVRKFEEYAVFVAFFPLLVAGPIERASHLIPQIQNRRIFNRSFAEDGFTLILWGLLKKIVVADNIAPAVDDIFHNYATLDSLTLIIGAIYFSFQIYCDFSGYSDIARGSAKLIGFDLFVNFNNPYASKSIPEFWKKWHISLSSWFRDYVYFPLGGSKGTLIQSVTNVFIIFVLSGLWHGANWTFLVWGVIHGCCYIPFFLQKIKKNKIVASNVSTSKISEFTQIIFTFTIVTIAWIFFRSDTIHDAVNYLTNIFLNLPNFKDFLTWRSSSTEGSHIEFLFIFKNFVVKSSILIIVILLFGSFVNPSSFIYFQF